MTKWAINIGATKCGTGVFVVIYLYAIEKKVSKEFVPVKKKTCLKMSKYQITVSVGRN